MIDLTISHFVTIYFDHNLLDYDRYFYKQNEI